MKRLTAVAAMLVAASAAFAQPTVAPTAPAKPATPAAQPAKPIPAGATLFVGDKAPTITVEKWVKGEPITGFEKGKVYVVEFWATWCGPCKAAMPHLSSLQKEYKDKGVTIIGTNIWEERPSYKPETLAKVEKFVKESTSMDYTVAYDGGAKATDKAYMQASGWDKEGIPTAFIVNQDGKVAYIGGPGEMDETLKMVVAGTHDLAKAKADYAKAQGEKTKAAEKPRPATPTDPRVALQQSLAKFEVEYKKLLTEGKYEEATKIAMAKLDGEYKTAAEGHNLVAWVIVDPVNKVAKKDLDLAFKAATKAMELSNNTSAAITDTMARVYFCKGDVDKAIEFQKKSVTLAVGNQASFKGELEATLKEYEAAKK